MRGDHVIDAIKIAIGVIALVLLVLLLRESRDAGTQRDAIHQELRTVNENLDQIQSRPSR